VELVGIIVTQKRLCSRLKESVRESLCENDKNMTATKVGSLKCCAIQVDGSELDVTLQVVKYVPELWVNLFSIN
jgi:hypothetical protein